MEIRKKERPLYVCGYLQLSFVMFVAVEKSTTSIYEAEFNWRCDPEAAYAVLAGLNKVITLLPFETCIESSLSWVCNIYSTEPCHDV